jgi:hypothetical protein
MLVMMCKLRRDLLAAIIALSALSACAQANDRPQEFVFPTAIEVVPVTRAQWDRSSPESAYIGIRAANLADDSGWILAGFAPGDREKVDGYLKNVEMRAANAKAQRAIKRERIESALTYKSFVILIVKVEETGGVRYTKPVPMVETADGWALTNALQADPVFEALMQGKL